MARIYDHSQQLRLSCRLGPVVATTAALTALPYEVCADGMLSVVTADNSIWVYRLAGAEALGPTVLADDAGKGQWVAAQQHAVAGLPKLASVRNVTAGALGAYTRTGNVILADAVGALGAIDGVTNVVGDRILLKNGAAGADDGLYRVDSIGGASKYQLTRVGDANASAEVVAGMLIYASEGTANGNTWFYLSTDDPIVLNATALTFAHIPTLVGVTSVETRVSTEECTRSTADSSLTVLVSSADSSLKVIDSAGDSSLTLITSSVETRLSTEECTRSTADSSLTVLVSSADSSVTLVMSTADSSLDVRVDKFATGAVCFDLHCFRETDGSGDVGNLAAHGGQLASDSTPSLSGGANEAEEIGWVAGNVDQIALSCSLPPDLDDGQAATLRLWVSSGAVGPDPATFSVVTSWDKGAQITDSASDGTPGAAIHAITATIDAGDIPATPGFLTLQLVPAAHANDPITLHAARLEYVSTSA